MDIHKKYLVDTNVLLDNPEILDEYDCIIFSGVLRELEKHVSPMSKEKYPLLAYKARKARNAIDAKRGNIEIYLEDYHCRIKGYDDNYIDNKILQFLIDKKCGLITYDKFLNIKCDAWNSQNPDDQIEIVNLLQTKEDEYKGYIELITDEDVAKFHESGGRNAKHNVFDLNQNQYLIVEPSFNEKGERTGQASEVLKWKDGGYKPVNQSGFSTDQFLEFKPKDVYQQCALDSMMFNKITMIHGTAGTGKSLASLSYAWSLVEKEKEFHKLVIFCNPVPSRDSAKLGYYKGDRNEKLLKSTVGTMLGSKFGSLKQVEDMINNENSKLMLLPFSDIRGFDTTGMKAIIWIVEAQNLDIELMKLGIQRCGEDSKIIIDGDFSGQVDMDAYSGSQNGMRRVSEIFRFEEVYGQVELPIIYRSKIAAIADKM
jgi:predicted ribonuclease YlaK